MAGSQLTDEAREFMGPHLPIGEYGLYPKRLRQQFEGVIWRFETGGQWREVLAAGAGEAGWDKDVRSSS
ncbi:hypothetical protein [Streptomyces sp. GS7]|uniref:hypothetical protein n=1 Tax=Streptomyces sp. GS7 TaxID=2692234 RepID=UPI00131685DD|nr:hypothetical protein [Streptomyces sp. GS7]QHC26276.1 hypothetical protein GR130_37790 [Streptomyces sp. GS7]